MYALSGSENMDHIAFTTQATVELLFCFPFPEIIKSVGE